ncbi:hypothetical protein BJY00DRAFT_91980 [Aspergillus carlsbadensis]|nr:hypothetical protein BJY00DRAFT_91980 [Aspergillus carlsbadensis]
MDPLSTSVACLNCREKHLKCDGNQNGCARCMSLSQRCYFVPSRRGRKTRPDPLPSIQVDVEGGHSPFAIPNDNMPSTFNIEEFAQSPLNLVAPFAPQQHPNLRLISLYYSHFHGAHPFLPPMHALLQTTPSRYLLEVMELIGSQYLPSHISQDMTGLLVSSTDEADLSLEKVQAYLLVSILSHGHRDPKNARLCIIKAIHSSLELGLHQREFSDAIGIENPVGAESVRRTWWEVFVIDAVLAAVQVDGSLQFNLTENPDVPLPCEEEEYADGRVDRLQPTLGDLEGELLPHDNGMFSSLAYRIEAAAVLRKSLLMAETPSSQYELDLLDASIAAWFHRVPTSKRSIIGNSGEVDQILFQANMLMHCASIYLHYPKSYLLASLPSARETFCSHLPGISTSSANPQIHTAKVVNGAVGLSKLAMLTTSVIDYSPFVACTLVLSSVIQLAVLSVDWLPAFGADCQFLSLNIGVLNSMSDMWPIAGNSMQRIRELTKEVQAYRSRDSRVLLDTFVM